MTCLFALKDNMCYKYKDNAVGRGESFIQTKDSTEYKNIYRL